MRREGMRILAALLVTAGLACAGVTGAATIFESPASAPILSMDTSSRSAAMGSAGTALFWVGPPSPWANPALLGYAEGAGFEWADTEYGFGVLLHVRRVSVGHAGLGFSTTGRPIPGLGDVSTGMDLLGGGFDERARSWSAGASLTGVWGAWARRKGREAPTMLRSLDIAIGCSESRVEDQMWLMGFSGPVTSADVAIARDVGLLLRASVPVHAGPFGPGRLEAGYGFAAAGVNAPSLGPAGSRIPVRRDWRNGFALRAALGGAPRLARVPASLTAGLAPLVSIGGALDRVHTTRLHADGPADDLGNWGAELGIANVAFARVGNVEGFPGSVVRTWGWGAALPVGTFGGVRFDRAYQPREPLPELRRDGWAAWLDPLAIRRAVR